MKTIAETPRLLLREWTYDDFEVLYRLCSDPLVNRFTQPPPLSRAQFMADMEARLEPPSVWGERLGRWAVIRKEDGVFLGWSGIIWEEEFPGHDLGYRYFQDYWGQGYATEAARACVEYGFESLNLDQIFAGCEPENLGSIKVLEKCGFQQIREQMMHDTRALVFQIGRPSRQG